MYEITSLNTQRLQWTDANELYVPATAADVRVSQLTYLSNDSHDAVVFI